MTGSLLTTRTISCPRCGEDVHVRVKQVFGAPGREEVTVTVADVDPDHHRDCDAEKADFAGLT